MPTCQFLSDLHPSKKGGLLGGLGVNKPYFADQLIIAGNVYPKGLCTHPKPNTTAFVEFKLGGQWSTFEVILGAAWEGTPDREKEFPYFDMRIIADGAKISEYRFEGDEVWDKQYPLDKLSMKNVDILRLEATSLGGNQFDHAAWGNPLLLGP